MFHRLYGLTKASWEFALGRLLAMRFNARPGRLRLLGSLAVWFVVAQIFYAAHIGAAPDPLLGHSSTSCAYCLAGATADDPTLLAAVFAPPTPVYADIVQPDELTATPEPLRLAANPRAPPSC
jgi:hypothetical protein